jgi:hypothetical protein
MKDNSKELFLPFDKIVLKERGRPEHRFRDHFRQHIKKSGWIMEIMASSMYSSGWPDTLLTNEKYQCHKYVEFKSKVGKLRESQISRFGRLSKCGIQIYVLEGDGNESAQVMDSMIQKLFGPANWFYYIRGVLG